VNSTRKIGRQKSNPVSNEPDQAGTVDEDGKEGMETSSGYKFIFTLAGITEG